MAQTQKPTNLGLAEISKRLATAGDTGSTEVENVLGLTGACTASSTSTFVNPGGATKATGSGFALGPADGVANSTTTVTDDTVEVDHIFTCTATITVTGFAVLNNDEDTVFMECCFDSGVACESDDTLTIEAKMKFVDGA